jgi:hypothetical protein
MRMRTGNKLRNKTWLLIATTHEMPFMIGDNPIARQNLDIDGNQKCEWFDEKGIEIFFPLSPTRAISMACNSYKQEMVKCIEQIQSLGSISIPQHIYDSIKVTETMLKAIENGNPFFYGTEEVKNFNALQISHAERFVFSSSEDLSFIKALVSSSDQLRKGRRTNLL